ncbi:hypothetical protein [Nocardioides sp. cx-173]|uniref:hypothetical protein n=1 Tax=Nocardioides sp. cx-173 TaxID=2898796 RepID=UPI001E3420A5|nr:hypothetical protein [Nocardioides sp. cx-173]MCD4523573.1 hypothetical protein [Nocardioides sp. cx-173]UGB42091.1 hypothetical protein LQ940_00840 [Nocardioides sp. cx-173]
MSERTPTDPTPPALREDVRLQDRPMRPVACSACGAEVAVRKSSPEQTSIQWSAPALRRCHERSALRPTSDRPNRQAFDGCSALRDTVLEAAARGQLEVLADAAPTTPPARPR